MPFKIENRKRKIINSKNKPLLLSVITVIIIIPTIVFGDQQKNYFSPEPNSTEIGTSTTGQSVTIINKSALKYFIPNNTSAEWNSFLAHVPTYVSVSSCGDGSCTDGESYNNCPTDCPMYSQGFCGDGICQSNGRVISGYNPFTLSTGETCSNCAVDCGICAAAVCALCGKNGQGVTCNDSCSSNGGTCVKVTVGQPYLGSFAGHYPSSWKEIMTLWRYNHGCTNPTSDTDPQCNAYAIKNYPEIVASDNYTIPSFGGSLGWVCSYTSASGNLCPAGSYCPSAGKGTGTHYPCPAGFYCPAGSGMPSFCPAGTYSAAGASSCTACSCQAGTVGGLPACDGVYQSAVLYFAVNSPLNSSSNFSCTAPIQYCGDGYCDNTTSETAASCPADCGTLGDGRCSGSETNSSDPTECHCGDGTCNYGETTATCPADCH